MAMRVLILNWEYPPIVESLRFRTRDAASLAAMIERVLTDAELRDRLVLEASEQVLRFDWADVARQTAAVYSALERTPARVTR